MKLHNFQWDADPAPGTHKLRNLTPEERESVMNYGPQQCGRRWTQHLMDGTMVSHQTEALGKAFEVGAVGFRLSPVRAELAARATDQRPLVVISLFDGIGGCLAALTQRLRLDKPIIYVSVEKDVHVRGCIADVAARLPNVTLHQIPASGDIQELLPPTQGASSPEPESNRPMYSDRSANHPLELMEFIRSVTGKDYVDLVSVRA